MQREKEHALQINKEIKSPVVRWGIYYILIFYNRLSARYTGRFHLFSILNDMKKFIKRLIIFLIPILILFILLEYAIRQIPNTYKYKTNGCHSMQIA